MVSFILGVNIIAYAIIPRYSEKLVNSLVMLKYPSDLDENQQFHAAFIINRSHDLKNLEYVGLDNLIKGFARLGYPFKIYHCRNEDEFKTVLKNKRAKYIWVFGHGWRGGVGWKEKQSIFEWIRCKGKESMFAYSNIHQEDEEYPKKAFIAQFHCNHELPIKSFIARHIRRCKPSGIISNIPLICILLERPFDESKYFISTGYLNAPSTWYFTRQLVKEISFREKRVESLRK